MYAGLEGGDAVGADQQPGGQGGDDGSVGADVAAHVAVDVGPESEQRTVVVGGDFHLAEHLAGMVGGDEVLQAVLNPLNWPFQLHGGEGNEEVFGIELASDAEAAAYIWLYEMDAVFGDAQLGYKDILDGVGDLGGAPHGEVAALVVVVRHQAASFQWVAGVAVGLELLRVGVIGVAEGRLDIAEANDAVTGEVGAVLLVEQDLVRQRLADIGDRRQGFVVHLDGIEGVLGQVAAFGDDQGHGLAHVTDFIHGQVIL